MDAQVVATIVCGLALLVGVVGTILPILPGSLLIAASLLGWAFVVGGPVGWVVFGIGAALVTAGMLSSAVLTGRRLKRRDVPNWSILAGIAVGIVGMFIIPVVGLIIGFAVGLFVAELIRRRDLSAAISSSVAALKATGIGILVECGFACLATSTWVIGVWVYFVTAG